MSEPEEDPVARAERQVYEEEEANNRSTAGTGPNDEAWGDTLGAEVEADEEADESR
jgi:hypothetical protein